MPMDPYSKVFRPDMQARATELPQWVPMGDSDQGEQITQASGTFADLLKKRMARGNPGSSMGSAMGAGMAGGAAGGGGGQSL